MAMRNSGEMRLLSNEYLTKNATPRKSAKPPIQAKPFTPMNCSQLMAGLALNGGVGAGSGKIGGMASAAARPGAERVAE